MHVKLQGAWEARRVADVLSRFANEFVDEHSAWANDCAQRIDNQVDAYIEKKRKEKQNER